ncbi:MAG: nucleoside monophosphate kinase [Parcubacteria group bacterium]
MKTAKVIPHIILLGPQGSGKGTQAEQIARTLRLVHIETGALIRTQITRRTSLGKRIASIVNRQGKLIPDTLVARILAQKLQRVPRSTGVVFDGFPRTLTQARILDELLKRMKRQLTQAIYLPISQRTTVRRLSHRRVCQQCGTPWITGTTIGMRTKNCPRCKGMIVQRDDDKPKTIKKRLREYLRKTLPIVSLYRSRGILAEVNGEPPIGAVWRKVKKII